MRGLSRSYQESLASLINDCACSPVVKNRAHCLIIGKF
jgi:hypothetical protein